MRLEGEAARILSVVSTAYCNNVTHTSMIYGGAGRMYGTYVGFGRSLRNWLEESSASEEVQIGVGQMLTRAHRPKPPL